MAVSYAPLHATPDAPLRGIRVLDLSWVFTGPLCTRALAMLGAEVIKVESRKRPDLSARDWIAPYVNVEKRSCTLDLSTERGKELARELVKRSDVIAENFSTGVMERLGLGYADLHKLKPDLIIVSSSPVGRTGPSRSDPAYGSMIQCLTGWGALSSYPGAPPTEFGSVWADPLSGTTLAFIVLAALYQREETGQGAFIDLSMAEVIMAGLPEAVMAASMGVANPKALGNRDPVHAPQGCYRCQGDDRWIAISVTCDAEWAALCEVIGRPDLAHDERFADGLSRWHHQDELDPIIETWTRQRTPSENMGMLVAAGAPAGSVALPTELIADPHLHARGLFARIEGDPANRFTPGFGFAIDGRRAQTLQACPDVGQDNAYVFGEVLGLSPEAIQALVEEKVIY